MTFNVLWMDGAENYGTVTYETSTSAADISAQMKKGFWIAASSTYLSSDPRTASYSFRLNDSVSSFARSLGGDQTRVGVLFSTKLTNLPNIQNAQWAIVSLRNALNRTIAAVQITPTGRVRVFDYLGNTIIQSTREVAAGVHNHFEVRLDSVAKTVQVRVNGSSSFTISSSFAFLSTDANNQNPAVQLPAIVQFGQQNGSDFPMQNGPAYWDDIAPYTYGSGDTATYLGLYGVYYLKPNADTSDASWTKSVGSNGYALINEVAPDDDTKFIYSGTVNDQSRFAVEPLPANAISVQAVQTTIYSRKSDSGVGSVQIGVKSGAVQSLNGTDLPLLTNYGYQGYVHDLDPATGSAWSPASLPTIVTKRTQ